MRSSLTILSLFQQLCQSNALVEECLRGGIQIGTELRESSNFTILGQVKFHRAGDLQALTLNIILTYIFNTIFVERSRGWTQCNVRMRNQVSYSGTRLLYVWRHPELEWVLLEPSSRRTFTSHSDSSWSNPSFKVSQKYGSCGLG